MGQVDSAEAHLQKLMSFLLERSQRICSRGLASSNLQHRKSRRAECEAAKPAGAQKLAARARSSRRNPSLLRLSGRGRRTCWIMQTALGEHAGSCKLRGAKMPEVRAPSPPPSWPLSRRPLSQQLLGWKRQNSNGCTRKLIKKSSAELGSFISF